MTRVRAGGFLCLVLLFLLATACGLEERGARDALRTADAVADWSAEGDVEVFGPENLYDLVDGQADFFFAYAFREVAVQTYEDASGATVRVEIWELGTPADAFGVFTTYRAGSPVAVGNGGDSDPGRRLDYWQDHFFVRISSISSLDDDILHTFAEVVSDALPAGGEPPLTLAFLPQVGMVERSEVFFHQEISIQDYLWLGGQNLLALDAETNGVLARYDTGGEIATVLLVQYPDSKAAASALEALAGSEIGRLVASATRDDVLVAVFGSVSEKEARTLLMNVLSHD
ncbi:MAG: hypothetical protein P8189_27145 [Anaerolineae bacterium]|jgi:hypothetical protein